MILRPTLGLLKRLAAALSGRKRLTWEEQWIRHIRKTQAAGEARS